MINKAFETVNNRLFKVLEAMKYSKQAVSSGNDNELCSLYIGEVSAYSVLYYKDKKYMVLRMCGVSEDGPDNEWKTVSTWMFDPAVDTLKEAENIGRDFCDTVDTNKKKIVAQPRNRKKGEDGNGDPIFFYKRLVAVFPELKDEIKYEELNYIPFRAVNFARENVVDRVNTLLASRDKAMAKKLGEVLSNQYDYGDLNVRSVITIVILNSVSENNAEFLNGYLSETLQKSWKNALKFKGKKVKPEKEKASKRSFVSDTLMNS